MRSFAFSAAVAAAIAIAAPPAVAADWSVDHTQSTLGFVFTQGGNPVTGAFTEFDAEITFDPADLAGAHVMVTVNIASISTGDGGRDTQARGGQWFDVGQFATATFEASTFTPGVVEGAYIAAGDLTLRGVRQAIELPFSLVIDGDTASVDGEVVLNRGTFGVGQGDFQSGTPIALDVTVTVDLVATRL